MSEPLDRSEVIDLLNRLGSEQDEDVLAAAREVHARVAGSGVTWEALLVPEETEDEPDDDTPDDDLPDDDLSDDDGPDDDGPEDDGPEDDGPDDDGPESTGDDGSDDSGDSEDDDEGDGDEEDGAPATADEKEQRNAETLALIEKLLARPDNSDEFRAELEEYKRDIAEGEFEPGDHRYIQALHKRLSKKR